MKLDMGSEIRRKLEGFAAHWDNGSVCPQAYLEALPLEISVVEPPYEGVDCEMYALGTSGIRHMLSDMFPNIEHPIHGDVVLYHSEAYGTVHVGRYQGDGTVISKWGKGGPVLQYPVEFVPSNYGESALYRHIPEEELEKLRGKDTFELIS